MRFFKGGNKMRLAQKRKWYFRAELLAICLLIMTGGIMIGRTFGVYGGVFLKHQDEELLHLAKLIDKNIESLLERCMTNLDYVTKRQGFLEAEENWKKTGKEEELLYRMSENIAAQDYLVYGMLLLRDQEVLLSTTDSRSFRFLNPTGVEHLQPCMGEDGTLYLALLSEPGEGMRYALLVDLNVFYHQIVGEELGEYEWVILTDISSRILMYSQQDQLHIENVDSVDGVTSATCGNDGVEQLLLGQQNQVMTTSAYEYSDSDNGNKYRARMVTLPTEETKNGVFAVGVVTNYEEVIEPFREAGVFMILYGGMIFAGIVLLLNFLLRFRRRNEQDLLELEILKKKNEEMEKLNRQAGEIAHLQRLETIGTLTSGVAHEFNNLLTPIMGYSILTLEQLPTDREDLQDNVLEIYQAACRAKEITTQLSNLSRKNTSLASTRFDLNELVKNVLHVARPVLPDGVKMQTESDGKPCMIEGNETQISQLILNLVINSFQAMEVTGGEVTVSVKSEEHMAVLRVSDTGPGIPEKLMKKIFEPFFTTKETGKGTGLGLAVACQVVREHAGTIWADSKEGEGCTFTVRLPM